MSITVFVEGGGRGKDLRTRCREGFSRFLEKLDLSGRQPKIVACGSRTDAFDRLCIAVRSDSGRSCVLLVDSEDVVPPGLSPWQHVGGRSEDKWQRPANATDHHLHFMAVCMEAWLVADVESLARFYGRKFKSDLFRKATDTESVDKATIMNMLRSATRDTTKGEYSKGKVSFAALGAIDVAIVQQRMSFCKRFVQQLLS